MTPMGWVHTIFAFVAIGAGGVVLLMRKGTRWHRTLGHLYATAMAAVTVTAFSLYTLTGRFGPFHFAAIVGGLTLSGGLFTVLARRPRKGWIEAHAIWMSWSYIGLMAAFASETLTRFVMPRVAHLLEANQLWGAFWTSVGVASLVVLGVGWWLVKRLLPPAVAGAPESIRRERRELTALASAPESGG